jgi:L-aspartate oxidase
VLQRAMTSGAGVLRSASSLADTASVLASLSSVVHPEVRNLVVVGLAVVLAASAREESRGAHNRTDFPAVDDARFCRRLVIA